MVLLSLPALLSGTLAACATQESLSLPAFEVPDFDLPNLDGPEAPSPSETLTLEQRPFETPGESPFEPNPVAPAENTIQQALTGIAIKGRAPRTGYNRDNFGQRWSDDTTTEFGHNGCDTRNDILNRDLINKVYKPNTRDCVVLQGLLQDPYTGADIHFQRGADSSAVVQIDHVVALADAWQKGAQNLNEEQRRDFANDPLNLLAVDGKSNQQKSDGDAATWLPPNKSFRCLYVGRQVLVKAKYQLWMTPAEHEATQRLLTTCSSEDIEILETLALHG